MPCIDIAAAQPELQMVQEYDYVTISNVAWAIPLEASIFNSPLCPPVVGPWCAVLFVLGDDPSTPEQNETGAAIVQDITGMVAALPVDDVPTSVEIVYFVDVTAAGPSTLSTCWKDKFGDFRRVNTKCLGLSELDCAKKHDKQVQESRKVWPLGTPLQCIG